LETRTNKIFIFQDRVAKIFYKRKDRDQDSPLNVGPLGEVFLKLGEINWHFRRREMKMDEGDEVIQLNYRE